MLYENVPRFRLRLNQSIVNGATAFKTRPGEMKKYTQTNETNNIGANTSSLLVPLVKH